MKREENNKDVKSYEDVILKKEKTVLRESQPAYMEKKYTLEDYYALPDEKRVELINGQFYEMLAPGIVHQEIVIELARLFRNYIKKKKRTCRVWVAPLDVQLDGDEYTMVQPDVVVLCDSDKISNRCIIGAPEFVTEILSPSTKKKDMGLKLHKYRNAGVREYWIVDPEEEKIIVYFFERDHFPTVYTAEDTVPVGIYDGDLKINFKEIFDGIPDIA